MFEVTSSLYRDALEERQQSDCADDAIAKRSHHISRSIGVNVLSAVCRNVDEKCDFYANRPLLHKYLIGRWSRENEM